MEKEILKNVNFGQFEDKFGNLIKEFEVIKYDKKSNNKWVEYERFESGRNYFLIDGQLYNRCNNSLLPLNMDFNSETCWTCYQIGKIITNKKRITNNEILFTCNGVNILSLYKQSYSDNTCFYTLQDRHGNWEVDCGSSDIQEIINTINEKINLYKKMLKEDLELSNIYNNHLQFYKHVVGNLLKFV